MTSHWSPEKCAMLPDNDVLHHHSSLFQCLQLFRQLGIQLVAAEDGDDVRLQRAHEGNVAQDIQDLVTDQFILKAELRETFVFGVDDRIFQRAAFAKAHLSHGFELPCEANGAGGRDFFSIAFFVKDHVQRLAAEERMRIDGGEGHAKAIIGERGDEFLVALIDSDAVIEREDRDGFFLLFDAGFEHHVDKGLGRAVADRRLGRVHLDQAVVDVKRKECGEDMLDGENFRRAVLERSCAHGIGDILALRSDCRRARKIASPEEDAHAGFGRMHGHGHRQPGVQAIAFVSNRFLDGVLFSIHDEYLS